MLHAAALMGFLLLTDRTRRIPLEPADALPMVELVMQEQKGHGPSSGKAPAVPDETAKPPPQPQAAPAPPAPSAPAQAAEPPLSGTPPPLPQETESAETLALPPKPAPPQPVQVPPQHSAPPPAPPPAASPPAPDADLSPHINLGGTDSLSNVLVTGERVIPAGPDPKVHNREPVYPDEAVRRGEQGQVVLLIHVTADGLAGQVDIERSSGFRLLDRAARDAVATWRFVPAVENGQPVPSSMSMRVVFQLN